MAAYMGGPQLIRTWWRPSHSAVAESNPSWPGGFKAATIAKPTTRIRCQVVQAFAARQSIPICRIPVASPG
jgi:hypothetical protein